MKLLLFIYFVAAGITWVGGEAGQGIAGRVAIADVFLLLLVAVVLLHPSWIRVPRLGRAALFMFMAFTLGLVNTQNLRASLVEWLVHGYLIVGFIVLYTLIVRMPWEERLEVAALWVRAATLLACFGLYEFVGGLVGLPGILSLIGRTPHTLTGLVGTFRNTGQAGVFFGIALATAIPLHRVSAGRRRTEMLLSIVLLGLAVMFTVKRAAMIGVAAGAVLLFLMDPSLKGRLRSALLAAVGAAVVIPAFLWMLENSAAYRWRIDSKLSERGADMVESFARENLTATAQAFTAHPVVGVGLGGITGVWTEKYEIHSTYLSVPAQTGIVGSLAYLWFMVVFFRACTRSRNDDPRAWLIGRLYLPLLLGLIISFGYTNHLRKREFWITAALATALMAPEALRRERTRLAPTHRHDEPLVPEPELAAAGLPGQ